MDQKTLRGADIGYQWYQTKALEWRSQARMLRTLQVFFVAAAIVSSVLAASRAELPSWWPTWLLSLIAALSVALFTGLDLNNQANKMRRAWRHLSAAICTYRDGAAETLDAVREAYGEAEEMIGDFDPHSKK